MATIEAFVVTTSKVHIHIGHSGFSIGAQMYTECLCQLFAFFCVSWNPFEKKAGKITKVFVLRAGLHAVCFSRHFYRRRLKIIDDSFPSENNIQHTIQYTLRLFNDLTINYAERFVYAFWCWLDWNVFSTSFIISFIRRSETPRNNVSLKETNYLGTFKYNYWKAIFVNNNLILYYKYSPSRVTYKWKTLPFK